MQVQHIPGVELRVFKEQRPLTVAPNGSVGELFSGYVVLAAIVGVGRAICAIVRHGNDMYDRQSDWAKPLKRPASKPWRNEVREWVSQWNLSKDAQVFGVKMSFEVDKIRRRNFIPYPNNMLMLVELVTDVKGKSTERLRVWKLAMVDHEGEFFLTVQLAYDTIFCVNRSGKVCVPRFEAHSDLEEICVTLLSEHGVPEDLPDMDDYEFPDTDFSDVQDLDDEGVVVGWYHARRIGTVLTSRGKARVHVSEVPVRDGRPYLVEGERIRFERIGEPYDGKRMSDFRWQVYGVQLLDEIAPVNERMELVAT